MASSQPDLGVVIPSLNEADRIRHLLETLSRQEGICLEVVVADGESADATLDVCRTIASGVGLSLRAISSPPGRGRQMNAGARFSGASDLLFLHADTTLEDPHLLARGRAEMIAERTRKRSCRVAGHFGLRFRRSEPRPSGAYYFYEAKTRLNRPDCIHGDQGFWLSRRYFEELSGFDESLPYMEDVRLAARVFQTGVWITLPGNVATSARRFETEGLRQRQTLNALLSAFAAIGLEGFFQIAEDAYREQDRATRLRLGPFYRMSHRLGLAGGLPTFARYWYRTGGYVAENAWQLAFALDCARNRRKGRSPGDGPTLWLDRFDRLGAPIVTSAPARVVTALLTAAWFYGSMLVSR